MASACCGAGNGGMQNLLKTMQAAMSNRGAKTSGVEDALANASAAASGQSDTTEPVAISKVAAAGETGSKLDITT